MKKNNTWIIAIILIVVGFVIFTRTSDTENKIIKIGVIEPLTGGASAYGEVAKNGFALAIDEINAAGGIDGKQVEVIYEDTKCTGKDALSSVQKLIDMDKVQYMVGGMCSSEVLGVLPVTEAKKMIFLGQGSSPDITGKGKFFFRTWPSDDLSGKFLVDALVPQYKKIAIISEKTDYATALAKTFSDHALTKGAEIVASETFVSDVKDFRPQLSKIKAQNPEVLFINPQTGQNGAIIAKQARELGINAQFVTFFFTGDEFVKSGPAVNGSIVLDVPSLDTNRSISVAYFNAYKTKYNSVNYPFVGAQMYDYAYLLKQAIEKNGHDADKIAAYLRELSEYKGVIGDFSFADTGDVENIGFTLRKVENNQLVDIK